MAELEKIFSLVRKQRFRFHETITENFFFVFLQNNQCDQIGQFLEFLANKFFVQKLPKCLVTFLGKCENHRQTGEATFRAALNNLGYFLFQHLVALKANKNYFVFDK